MYEYLYVFVFLYSTLSLRQYYNELQIRIFWTIIKYLETYGWQILTFLPNSMYVPYVKTNKSQIPFNKWSKWIKKIIIGCTRKIKKRDSFNNIYPYQFPISISWLHTYWLQRFFTDKLPLCTTRKIIPYHCFWIYFNAVFPPFIIIWFASAPFGEDLLLQSHRSYKAPFNK